MVLKWRIGDLEDGVDRRLEREMHNEVLRDVTVGGTLGSGGQWPVRRMGYKKA
jgi:hypothetical protein